MTAALELLPADALMRRRFPPQKFVVPGLVPEGLTLLAGRPKLGKSWLAMNVSLAVAAGNPVLDRDPGEAGDVLHLALEDGPRRLQDRLRQMLGGAQAPARLSFATACPTLDMGGADAIRGWVEKAKNPRLVVVDVFQRIRGKSTDAKRLYADDYSAALPLKNIADEFGLAVVVVTHCRKSEADNDPLDAVSATTGLTGAADTILILDRDRDGTSLYARGRDTEEVDLALRFDPRRGLWQALGDRDEATRSGTRNAILAALKAAGTAGPKALADATGLSHDVVRQQLLKLADAGHVLRIGRGEYGVPTTHHSHHNHHNPDPSSLPSLHNGEGEEGAEVTMVIDVTGVGRAVQ